MKFTKTAIAVAIAGIAAAPMVVSADTTLSGAVQLRVNGSDADGIAGDPGISTGDVLVGVSTSHELNSGLTGYGSLRIDLDRLSNAGTVVVTNSPDTEDDDQRLGSAGTADSVYVGIKGGFGDIRIGEVPNAVEYGQKSTDIFDVAGEVNGGISYTGSFGAATFGAQFSPEKNSDMVGAGVSFSVGGFGVGLGAESRADIASVAAGVSFAVSGISVGAHVWSKEQDDTAAVAAVADDPATAANEAVAGSAAVVNGDLVSFAVNLGYATGNFSGKVTFTAQEDDANTDDSAVRLDLGYALGGGMDISTRIQSNDTGDSDSSAWRIQLSKTF